MRWSLVARYSLFVGAAVLALAIGLALTMDFGRFKGSAEAYISSLLERELTIAGPLKLTLGRTIDFSAQDVRLASTDWSADPRLASARRIEARVNTWSLISGTVRVESLAIDAARISLERNAIGESNWSSLSQAAERAEEDSSNLPERLPVMFDDTRISDTILNYSAPDRPRPFRFAMHALTAEIDDSDQLGITLQGDINETPLELEVTAGRVEDLIELTEAEFELSGNLGEIGLEGNASFADLLHPSRPTARLTLSGPNVEYLTDILRIDRVTSGPLDLSLSISPLAERMQFDLSGDVGEFVLLANGQFVDLQQAGDIDLQVSASGPSARTVADLLGWQDVPDDPFSAIGAFRRSGSDVSLESSRITIGETQFDLAGQFRDFPDPSGASAELRISGPDFSRFNRFLGLPGRLGGPFEVNAGLVPLETGGAEVDITAFARDITLSAQGNITDAPDFVGTDLRLEFTAPDLSVITQAVGLEVGPEERFTGSLSVRRVVDGAIIEEGIATIGDDRFAFSGRVGDQLPVSWDVQFEATSPDFKTRLAVFGIESEQLPAGDLQAVGSIRSEGDGFALEDVALSYADTEAELSGRVGALPNLEGTDVALRVAGEELSRWLPPRDAFSALGKPFDVEADLRLVDGTLQLSGMQLQMDETRLTGNLELMRDGIPDRGSFSLQLISPDVFVLLPHFAELAVSKETPLELRASGDWADNLWNLDEFDMQLAEGSLQASGTVDGPPDFDGTQLRLDWNISSISNFSVLAGRELPDEPAHVRFQLTGTRDEMSIDDFDGVLGDSDFSVDFSLQSGDVPAIAIDFTSNRFNLAPYLSPLPEGPVEQAADIEPQDDRVIPDIPVRIDVLEGFLANASVRVDELNLRERVLRDVVLSASVADGALTVDEFELDSVDGGLLSGLMVLRPSATGPEFGMRLRGKNSRLSLSAVSPEELEDLPENEFDLAFIATGNTVREMAGNMNGYLRLVEGEGRMRFGAMSIFTQDFLSQLLNTLNPFSETDPYTNLKCMVILATVEGGALVGDPVLVVQSDKLNIFANAEVDLKTERVDADFNTVPQRGLGLSVSSLVNPYINVSGTLANPTLGFDPKSSLVEGGAAVATGGLSIIAKSLSDRFLTSRDPCEKALSDADEQFRMLEEKYGRSFETGNTD